MNTTTLNGLNCPCVLSLDDEYKLVFCLGHLGKQIQMSPSCALHNALKEEVILATLQSHFLWKTEMFLYKHVSENEVEGGTCSFPLFLFCHWTIITEILSFLLKKSQKKTITLLSVNNQLADQCKNTLDITRWYPFLLSENAKRDSLKIPYISLYFTCYMVLLFCQSVENLSELTGKKGMLTTSLSIPIYIGMRRKKIMKNTLIINFISKGLFHLKNLI